MITVRRILSTKKSTNLDSFRYLNISAILELSLIIRATNSLLDFAGHSREEKATSFCNSEIQSKSTKLFTLTSIKMLNQHIWSRVHLVLLKFGYVINFWILNWIFRVASISRSLSFWAKLNLFVTLVLMLRFSLRLVYLLLTNSS